MGTYMVNFKANEAVSTIIDWIKEYFAENGPDAPAVIGISGGKDSTVAAALLVMALGADRVIGVRMPCGVQHDIDTAKEVCERLGIRSYEVNIDKAYDGLFNNIPVELLKDDRLDIYYTNTPARLRMTALYGIAGLVGGRVANTCNRSEDYVGYSTKWGDNVGDFGVLANYTVSEVKAIGRHLGLPAHLIDKVPEDGMSGKSDEAKLGFIYQELDDYLLYENVPNIESLTKIKKLHKYAAHKVKSFPIAPNYLV